MSARRGRASGDQAVELGRAARRVTDRDRWLLRMLHEHTVLTTPQLTRLRFAGSARSVQVRLRDLRRWGLVERFAPMTSRGSAPGHHVLGPLGARILAAEIGVDVAALGWRRDRALAVAHRLSLGHDVAMTTLAVDLVTAADLHVVTWWSPGRCRRVFGHHVRPDAYIAATAATAATAASGGGGPVGRVEPGAVRAVGASRVWEMACEYDTGSTTLGVLAAKLRGYHDLAAATGVVIPVGVWVALPGREPGARHALGAALRALPDPRRVLVLTGTRPPEQPDGTDSNTTESSTGTGSSAGAEAGYGAAGRVWSALNHPRAEPRRVRLADLAVPARVTLAEILHGPADVDEPHRDPLTARHSSRYDDWYGGDALPSGRGGRIELPAPSPYPPPVLLPPPAQAQARARGARRGGRS